MEDVAFDQAVNLANLPFAFKHIALMPDAHMGYGMPIGGVLATKDVVIPNAVGVDIGCGMCAVRLPLITKPSKEKLKQIMSLIRENIPVGFKKHKKPQPTELMPPLPQDQLLDSMSLLAQYYPVCYREFKNASKSLGTLGGGNHFIEIQYGSDGHVWIMIHSGSRNLGKQVADYYNKLAIGLNETWFSSVLKKWELAFLPLSSKEGKAYLREMTYCVDFALANRSHMMLQIMEIFRDVMELCMKFKVVK